MKSLTKALISVLTIIILVCVLFACGGTYKVTFKDLDGNIIKEVEVSKDDIIDAPTITPPQGYEFIGWSEDLSNISSDLEVVPEFAKAKYNVIFNDKDGNLYEKVTVEYENDAVAPVLPDVEGYTFKGWDKDLTKIKSDLVVNPIYEALKFIVTFKDKDGNVYETQEVEYGKSAISPSAPVVDGLNFLGWDKDITSIKENIDVNPKYETIKYTVTFKDKDNNIIETQEVEYGKPVIAPDAPIVDGFVFVSWDKNLEKVYDNIEVLPIYETKKYEITFKTSFGEVFNVIEWEHGKTLEFVSPLDIDGYKFTGWSESEVIVTEPITIIANYEAEKYTIKYFDGGNELSLLPNEYSFGEITYLPNYNKNGKYFVGWFENNINNVNEIDRVVSYGYNEFGNKELYAKWEEMPNHKCPVGTFTFKSIKSTPHSSNPNLIVFQPDFTGSGAPSTGVTAYNWSTGDSSIATISAYSTITVVSNGITYIKAELKSDPSKVGYVLIKTSPTGVTAVTEAEANKFITYNVKFKDYQGNVISEQTIKEGGNATTPDVEIIDGKAFDGWNGKFYGVTSDIEVQAKYRTGTNKYSGKTVSILGDSISTYQTIVPEGYSCFYPYPTADVKNYNDTWWMQVINRFGMKLLRNNSYSGTCVSTGTGNYSTTLDSRLANLLKDGEKPDVIFIFMGANDCGSIYVNKNTFKNSYEKMLEKIKTLCPDSEIICMTLPKAKMYSDADCNEYSQVIIDSAIAAGCKLVNLNSTWDPSNFGNLLCDSIHPLKLGMDKIAETIYYSIK